jgi:hypothetical protein
MTQMALRAMREVSSPAFSVGFSNKEIASFLDRRIVLLSPHGAAGAAMTVEKIGACRGDAAGLFIGTDMDCV